MRHCWEELPNHYPHVKLDAFAIMPDRVHGSIVLSVGRVAGDEPVRHGRPEIVRAL